VPGISVIDGSERLRQRPMQPLVEALAALGANIEAAPGGALPIRVIGRRLRGGKATLEPRTSSQFVTSLVMAAPLMEKGLDLSLVGRIPSRPYLDLTESVMRDFGADFSRDNSGRRWRVNPGDLEQRSYCVEGDWSAAAFFLAAVAVAGGSVAITSLNEQSGQGDRIMCDILQRAGMEFSFVGETLIAKGPVTAKIEADLSDSPDLFPALAVVAASAPAGSKLTGLECLRHKESDRLAVMVQNLEKLGVGCEASLKDFVVFRPLERFDPKTVLTAASDHRIAMAMAVAALKAGSFRIDDAECVEKSFPSFWLQWEKVISSACQNSSPGRA
jgi:3-phosphoshikimate 1-carboxyvinyltransferase